MAKAQPFLGFSHSLSAGMGTVWDLVKQTLQAWFDDNVMRMSAALAFYTIFSVAPALLIGLGVAGAFIGDGAAKLELMRRIGELVSPEVADYVLTAMDTFLDQLSGRKLPAIGVIVGIVAATAVFAELQSSLNTIWQVEGTRSSGIISMIRRRAVSFILVVGVGVLLLVSMVTSTVLSAFDDLLSVYFPVPDSFVRVLNLCISLAMVPLLLALAYKLMPDRPVAWRDVIPGAVVATVLFVVGKYAFGLYMRLSTIISVYGAAGSFVVLLLWVYYSAQVFFLGAELTKIYAINYGSLASTDSEAPRSGSG